MRTLVIYQRDREPFAVILDHEPETDPAENMKATDLLRHEFEADATAMFFIELPNDTFRPLVMKHEKSDESADEVGISFKELKSMPEEA